MAFRVPVSGKNSVTSTSVRRICGRDLILSETRSLAGGVRRSWLVLPGDRLSDRCLALVRERGAVFSQGWFHLSPSERPRVARLILETFLTSEALSPGEERSAREVLQTAISALPLAHLRGWDTDVLVSLSHPVETLRRRGLEVAALLYRRLPRSLRNRMSQGVARVAAEDPSAVLRRSALNLSQTWEE